MHRIGVVILFGFVSFWALREFITMTPTRRGDHRTLFWVFFIFTPLQYLFVGLGSDPPAWIDRGRNLDFYGLYSIMIPVYASLLIPARAAIAGDYKRFLERCAKIQSGLLICVYSLSYAPALLDLDLKTTLGEKWGGSNVSMLVFFSLARATRFGARTGLEQVGRTARDRRTDQRVADLGRCGGVVLNDRIDCRSPVLGNSVPSLGSGRVGRDRQSHGLRRDDDDERDQTRPRGHRHGNARPRTRGVARPD